MTKTWPVFKREMKAYFNSPIIYVVASLFLIVTGITFVLYLGGFVQYSGRYQMAAAQNPEASAYAPDINAMLFGGVLGNMSVVLLFLLPFLTMRLFAEEKRSGTSELLFSYPVKDVEILMGKFLASGFVFALIVAFTLLTPFIMMVAFKANISWPVLFSGYLGLLLAGLTYTSIGIFYSSLTENQIIAAALTLITFLSLWLIRFFEGMVGEGMGKLLAYISILSHQENFLKGIVDTGDLLYYLCFIFLGLFLTLRSLESRRWRT